MDKEWDHVLTFDFSEENKDLYNRLKIISLKTGKPIEIVLSDLLKKGIDEMETKAKEQKNSMN